MRPIFPTTARLSRCQPALVISSTAFTDSARKGLHFCQINPRASFFSTYFIGSWRYTNPCAVVLKYKSAPKSTLVLSRTFNHITTSRHDLFSQNAADHLLSFKLFCTSSTSHSAAEIVSNGKERYVEIKSGTLRLTIPFIWLRDHCRSQKYYDHKTEQKKADPDLLQKDFVPAAVEYSKDKSGIVVKWKDGHITEFSFDFLISEFYPGYYSSRAQRLTWDKSSIQSGPLPSVSHEDHMSTELGLKQSLRNLVRYGFTFVEGTPATIEATQAVVERIGFVLETYFGRMWTVTSDGTHSDTAYTKVALCAHTDNTYFTTPAGIEVFHCLENTGSGGETLLVDGFNAMEILRASDPSAFEILSKTVVPHEYKERPSKKSPGAHFYSLATVISAHPSSGELVQIRYNPYDRAPLNTIVSSSIEAFYEAYDKLSKIIASPSSELWIRLQPGSVLFFDNWRVLHGRSGFDGKRVLCGCYLPRDEWISKARVMGIF